MSQFLSYSAKCHSLYLILLDVTVSTLFCWMSQFLYYFAGCRTLYTILPSVILLNGDTRKNSQVQVSFWCVSTG